MSVTTGNDTLSGSNGDDLIDLLAGSDSYLGLDGNDVIAGNDGNDTIYGGNGDDIIAGGNGDDRIFGEAGNDTIDAGAGISDRIFYNQTGGEAITATITSSGGNTGINTATVSTATQGTDSILGFERLVGSDNGDRITVTTAATHNNNLFLFGGVGNDTIIDNYRVTSVYADYNSTSINLTSGISVDLTSGIATDGFGGTDSLVGITAVNGTSFDDTILGSARNDVFRSWQGNDLMDGRGGTGDMADYQANAASQAVSVNLADGRANDGMGGTDTLISIENLRGGAGDDVLIGNSSNNTFRGNAGNDTIDGAGGTFDTGDYAFATAAVSVNLGTGQAQDGQGGVDSLANIEVIWGSAFADTLIGGNGNDNLRGNAGNDTIDGGAGTADVAQYTGATTGITVNLDTGIVQDGQGGTDNLAGIEQIWGSSFNDSMLGGSGNDFFVGSTGADTFDGGLGVDAVSYSFYPSASNSPTQGVSVDLATGTARDAFGGVDRLVGIEIVEGSSFADTITGGAADEIIRGNGGADSLSGGAGNDQIYAFGASDIARLDGGTGNDALSGSTANDTMSGGDDADTLYGNGGNDSLDGGNGDDQVFASGASNMLGGEGNDQLFGGTGAETILGGNGADSIYGNGGNDSLDGGAGDDQVYASGASNMLGDEGNDQLSGSNGADTILGGNGADSIYGNGGADSLDGGAGDDQVVATGASNVLGGEGNDQLWGSNGAETILGGNGADSIYGNGGTDSLIGGNDNDYLNAFGSSQAARLEGGDGDDELYDGSGADTMSGGAGNDFIYSSAGADSVSGGEGDDNIDAGGSVFAVRLDGDAGNDTLNAGFVTGGSGGNTLSGGTGNDFLNVGQYGGNSLSGGDGSDDLRGNAGTDTLDGGAGSDTLTGGSGIDFASYANASGTIEASLRDDTVGGRAEGADGSDRLFDIVGLIGGNFDDTLIGTAAANTLMGGNGADSLSGGGGSDLLDFGDGTDRFDWVQGVTGFAGNVTLIGGDGNDTLNLGDDWRSGPVTDNTWINFQKIDGSSTVYSQGWETIVCFAEGTRIVTPNGEDAVENLRAGDMVLAMRDGQAGFEPLRWVGFMDVAVPRNAAMAAKTAPILIKAGAIAPGMPARDLRVSPDHAMEVDGHLIPAKHLVNGSSIIQEIWCKRVRYFHLELEAHGLLLSEGTWSESYLDDGNRHAFNNAALTGLFLDFEAGRSKGQYDHRACLPVLRQGLKLDEIHGRIALRAEELARGAKGRRRG